MSSTVSPSQMSMTPPVNAGVRPASHQVMIDGDRVTVRNLELFVGYDPDIDAADNKRIRKYDEDRVRNVVDVTRKHMQRGSNPKLIVGHNRDGGSDFARPAIGDIVDVRFAKIGGAPGIVGDVEMSVAEFESYLKSNHYPRRSAEIWHEGHLSEVALLGSETPARPLPDTKFSRSDDDAFDVERFSRAYAAAQFAEPVATSHDPGPGNASIPSKKGRRMTKEEIKAQMSKHEEAMSKLKAQLSDMDDGEGKEDNAKRDDFKRQLDAERDKAEQFERQRDEALSALRKEREAYTRDRYTAKLNEARHQGYAIPADRFGQILERIVTANDPDAEYDFCKAMWHRDPVGMDGAGVVRHARQVENTDNAKREELASMRARERCEREGKPDEFDVFMREELAKTG